MVQQVLPGIVIMGVGIMGVGYLPRLVHRLRYGEERPMCQDNFDHHMRMRNWRIQAEAAEAAKAAKAAAN